MLNDMKKVRQNSHNLGFQHPQNNLDFQGLFLFSLPFIPLIIIPFLVFYGYSYFIVK